MMETVSAPVWEPDEGGALPWIGLITRSSPSRHYPLINHVMIKTFNGGLIILSFGHYHVCSSLSPWCQCSMSFDLSLLLITNVSPSVGNNKSPFDIFAVYGSWTFNPPSQDDIDEGQLIIWAAASSPITRTTTWCLGPLAPSECEGHSHQRGSTLVSSPSPSPCLFLLSIFPSEREYRLLVCVCLS